MGEIGSPHRACGLRLYRLMHAAGSFASDRPQGADRSKGADRDRVGPPSHCLVAQSFEPDLMLFIHPGRQEHILETGQPPSLGLPGHHVATAFGPFQKPDMVGIDPRPVGVPGQSFGGDELRDGRLQTHAEGPPSELRTNVQVRERAGDEEHIGRIRIPSRPLLGPH